MTDHDHWWRRKPQRPPTTKFLHCRLDAVQAQLDISRAETARRDQHVKKLSEDIVSRMCEIRDLRSANDSLQERNDWQADKIRELQERIDHLSAVQADLPRVETGYALLAAQKRAEMAEAALARVTAERDSAIEQQVNLQRKNNNQSQSLGSCLTETSQYQRQIREAIKILKGEE